MTPESDSATRVEMAQIRQLVAEHGRLAVDVQALPEEADLHDAGLSSFASVQLMLALEDEFGIEFPERLLSRATFRSLAALRAAVEQVVSDQHA